MSQTCHSQISAPHQLDAGQPFPEIVGPLGHFSSLSGVWLLDRFRASLGTRSFSMAEALFDQNAWLKRIG